jgi:hypothetical protein
MPSLTMISFSEGIVVIVVEVTGLHSDFIGWIPITKYWHTM